MSHLQPPPERELPRLRMVGEDGNAFAILGRWQQAARRVGWTSDEVSAVVKHATSGDYNHLLATVADNCEEVGEERVPDDIDW